jgi:hypothetical protein
MRSADPDFDEDALFPCYPQKKSRQSPRGYIPPLFFTLATLAPAPAATIEAVVDTL